jgi:hypothetical protein
MGIAPKQKFILAIESFGKYNMCSRDIEPLQTLMAIVHSLIDPKCDWLLYGQWSQFEDTRDITPIVYEKVIVTTVKISPLQI